MVKFSSFWLLSEFSSSSTLQFILYIFLFLSYALIEEYFFILCRWNLKLLKKLYMAWSLGFCLGTVTFLTRFRESLFLLTSLLFLYRILKIYVCCFAFKFLAIHWPSLSVAQVLDKRSS